MEQKDPIITYTFYKSGRPKEIISMLNGGDHGTYFRFYDDAGSLSAMSSYKNGKRHGQCWSYFPNGVKELLRTYKDGVLDGPYIKFKPNGTWSERGYHSNGELHGECAQYDGAANTTKRVIYKYGKEEDYTKHMQGNPFHNGVVIINPEEFKIIFGDNTLLKHSANVDNCTLRM